MWIIIVLGAISAALFWLFPTADIWFSNLFYDGQGGFIHAEDPAVEFIYKSVEIFTTTVILLLLVNLAGKFLQDKTKIVKKTKKVLPYRKTIYLLLVLTLGPGLMVHEGFKEFLSRPRPKHIVEFGGVQQYAKPFEYMANAEGKSFVSGHAAMGFYISSLAFILNNRRKKLVAYSGGIFAGTIIGLGRIIQGKHFLSDVIFSGIFILLLAHILYWIMFRKKKSS